MTIERDNRGRLVKGHKALPGCGKPKGYETPEKKMKREMLGKFVAEHYNTFVESALQLEARDFCRIYLEAMRYVIAPLQSIDITSSEGKEKTIEDVLSDIMTKGN